VRYAAYGGVHAGREGGLKGHLLEGCGLEGAGEIDGHAADNHDICYGFWARRLGDGAFGVERGLKGCFSSFEGGQSEGNFRCYPGIVFD